MNLDLNLTLEDIFYNNTDNLTLLINEIIKYLEQEIFKKDDIIINIVINDKKYLSKVNNQENLKTIIEQEIKFKDNFFGKIEIKSNNQIEINSEIKKLILYISKRISNIIYFENLKVIINELQSENTKLIESRQKEWQIILETIRKTDQNLYSILSRKMLNFLFTKGIKESHELFKKMGSNDDFNINNPYSNRPSKKRVLAQAFKFSTEIYQIASKYFSDDEIINRILKWINEEKTHYLVKLLANSNASMNEINDALRKVHQINPNDDTFNSPTGQGIKVALIRRFLTDSLEFIDIAKSYFDVEDFYNILQNIIFSPDSHGKLGGKGSGLLVAKKIIEKSTEFTNILTNIKFPKTWYIASDGLYHFMYYNNMEDVIEQKYKDIEDIRNEYPYIVQAFKNAQFPPEILNGLSRALDDFGDNPIIVRSSSLLEDRIGSAFAGKYKSLFLANQGTKIQKMEELLNAISEVYASTFGPDPIGYRTERRLLDFNEEMGILIQEVVGKKVGKYFFPAFAGVAFSYNDFRWSPRIKREDGLIRLVVGLGTRAVDRIGMDFPILISPGNPNLRVNQTFEEIVNYAPKYIDVIDLEKNSFETIPLSDLINEVGNSFPMLNSLFSIIEGHHIKAPVGLGIDTNRDEIVVTFDNLIKNKVFIEQIKAMLNELKDKYQRPVDIEFAHDSKNLYLLQCRPQFSTSDTQSAIIPEGLPKSKILFTANKYISNGKIPDIVYIVYVDPKKYKEIKDLNHLYDVGKAVGLLNKKLPRKTFILMGPGRWGSRDDIRLGVKVTYSDIHNTAVLIEIAKKTDNYTPDLSFGTHFFQDLVETGIKYIPLYPDEDNNFLNEEFLLNSENTLTRFLPGFDHISEALRVINVREATSGLILRILLNATEDRAIAYFTDRNSTIKYQNDTVEKTIPYSPNDEPLQWRKRMAESLALKIDKERFGVEGVYLYGTVFNETAGPNSDIDLLIHFEGTEEQKKELQVWLEGWNYCLSQLNYNRSGYSIENFLDVTFISSKDFKEKKYYEDLINPANKSSLRLRLKNEKLE